MSKFPIVNVKPTFDETFKKGVYIIIRRATDQPPHLFLLVENKIFALNVKGNTLGEPFETYLKVIKLKKIKTLFLKLRIFNDVQTLYDTAFKYTSLYSKIEKGVSTCLFPIKNFCRDILHIEVNSINYIFDLLTILYKKDMISGAYHYYMEEDIIDNIFYMEKYTMDDIYKRIDELS